MVSRLKLGILHSKAPNWAPVSNGRNYKKGEFLMSKIETANNLGQQQNAQIELLVSLQESITALDQRLAEMEDNIKDHRAEQSALARKGFLAAMEPLQQAVERLNVPPAPVALPERPSSSQGSMLAYWPYLAAGCLLLGLMLWGMFAIGERSELNRRQGVLASMLQETLQQPTHQEPVKPRSKQK